MDLHQRCQLLSLLLVLGHWPWEVQKPLAHGARSSRALLSKLAGACGRAWMKHPCPFLGAAGTTFLQCKLLVSFEPLLLLLAGETPPNCVALGMVHKLSLCTKIQGFTQFSGHIHLSCTQILPCSWYYRILLVAVSLFAS